MGQMASRVLLAIALLLALVLAEEPAPLAANSTMSPCKCDNGKCESTDEGTMVCVCNPGYQGEKCDEVLDEWDVYWTHAMRKSQLVSVKPRADRSLAKLAYIQNRITALNKRTDGYV